MSAPSSSTIYPFTHDENVEEKWSEEYTFTEIIIHSNNSDTSNNNNNSSNNNSNNNSNNSSSNIKGILKKPKNDISEQNIMLCVKSFAFIILLGFTVPFIVCNIYYAYNDTSCVTINPDHFGINLKTYLVVDGILGAIVLFIIIFAVCCIKEEPNSNNCCLNMVGNLATVFGVAWTIIGEIIFWKLIDNTRCDRAVYNYVFAQLVIKFIGYSLRICANNNNNKNK